MPVAIPFVIAAVAAVGEGVIVGASLTSILLSLGASLVLTGLQMILQPGTKSPAAPGLLSYAQTVKQAVTSHRLVYGQQLVSGPVAFMATSDNNLYLHIIILLAAHQVDSIDEVWLNTDVISNDCLDSDGNVTNSWTLDDNGNLTTGVYAGYVRLKKHLGNPNQVADSDLVAECPQWTTAHRLQGIAYIYARLQYDQSIFPGGIPNISAVMRGMQLTDPRTGNTVFSTNGALICYDYMSQPYGFGAATRNLSEDNISAQANIADEIVATDDYDIDITAVDTTLNLLQLGDILTLGGAPVNICPLQTGDQVQISSTGSMPSGISASTNYYLIVYQFSLNVRVGLATTLANAMSQTFIDITSAGSGTLTLTRNGEPRYHGGGVTDTLQARKNNFSDMLTMIAGKCIYANGLWTLLCGAWVSASETFSEDDFAAPMQLQTKLSMQDRFNQLQGNYISSINSFQPSAYPMVFNSAYIADDDSVPILKQLDLPFTNRCLTAQRIALIALLQSRWEITLTTAFNLKGMLVQAADVIGVTSVRYGWSAKNFEITQWGLSAPSNNNNAAPALQVPVTLRETDSSVYDWSSSFGTEISPAVRSNLPSAFAVGAPVGLSFSSRAVTTASGDTIYNLVLAWDTPTDQFVLSGGSAQIQYKESSDTVWRPFPNVPADQDFADIASNSIGVAYDIQIRFVNVLGVPSAWQTITGARVGTSGGVGATEDWGAWTGSVGTTADWGAWTGSVGTTNDWGYFT